MIRTTMHGGKCWIWAEAAPGAPSLDLSAETNREIAEALPPGARVAWVSVDGDDLDPAVRLNPHDPTPVEGGLRYRVPTVDEHKRRTGEVNPQAHKVEAALAVVIGAAEIDDAAFAARVGPGDLVAEAEGWAAAVALGKR